MHLAPIPAKTIRTQIDRVNASCLHQQTQIARESELQLDAAVSTAAGHAICTRVAHIAWVVLVYSRHPSAMATSESVMLTIFYGFSLTGQIVLTASLVTVAVARLRRDVALLNVSAGMILFSTACLLLLYANEFRGAPPVFGLCLAQACLIYGSLWLTASSIFCLFFQLWYNLRTTLRATTKSSTPSMRPALKILPWAAFSFASFASLIVGLARPDRVTLSRNFFYCSVSPPVGYISEAFCGLVMAASVIIQVHIGYTLLYGWRARTLRRDLLPVGSIMRLSIFSVYATTSVIVVIIMLRFPDANTPRYPFILMSAFPLVGWIIFWTQRDILEIWICRRRKGAQEEQPSGDRDTLSAAGDTTPEDYVKSSKVDEYA